MASVRCEAIRKNFGDVQILKGIDLDIQDGEFVVFVGPSGCGKTTLLRLIAGLEDITAGDIYIDKKIVNHVPPKDRNIAMVFQNYAIYPHMTVADNIGFGMKLRGSSKSDISIAVEKAADLLGLAELLERKPKQLSGGQRQRVAMGRAIVRDPSVFLMDEPLSNLDAELRNQMRIEIKSLQHRLGTTTIYVTHDQIEAMTLADRIAVMNDGEILHFGPPNELYTKPKNKFVASFIGSPRMNFLNVKSVAEERMILENDCQIMITNELQRAVAGFSEIEIGVRPESIHIVDDLSAIDPARGAFWQATVRLCEELGSETIVHFGSGPDALQVKASREIRVSEGDQLGLVFDHTAVHYFCRKTGVCIRHAEAK